jgi:hypothetical protein
MLHIIYPQYVIKFASKKKRKIFTEMNISSTYLSRLYIEHMIQVIVGSVRINELTIFHL